MKISIKNYDGSNFTETEETVVAIDVFRATSVMVLLIAKGAKKIIPVVDIDNTTRDQYEKNEKVIFIGEKNMLKHPHCDYGNSPTELMNIDVKNKIIVMATTNGTQLIKSCQQAKKVYACAFINYSVIAEKLLKENKAVSIVCAGSQRWDSVEDTICAAMLAKILLRNSVCELDEMCTRIVSFYNNNIKQISRLLTHCCAYKNLGATGFIADALFCLLENSYPITPFFITQENEHVCCIDSL